MDTAGQDARLDRCREAGLAEYARGRNTAAAQQLAHAASVVVAADDAQRDGRAAQGPDVVHRVGAATQAHVDAVVAQDQHGRFPADALHAPVDELVGHQVGQHEQAPALEAPDQLEKTLRLGPRRHALPSSSASASAATRSTVTRRMQA